MSFRLTTRPGHPTFVDLPWEDPLEQWDTPRLVTPVRGISRHVVRFVAYGGDMYAVKELPGDVATREYRLLRELDERSVPVVEAVGVASGRLAEEGHRLDDVLITKHLQFSLPYRALFMRTSMVDLWQPLLDGLAEMLVRAHLAGFFWGDCSLSNALFRRDAGRLAAWLVDAETGELHDQLSNGQRFHDLEIAEVNVAGELLDIAAARRAAGTDGPADDLPFDPAELADDLRHRYDALWAELTDVEVFGTDEQWRIDERIRRLNALGFDVDELELIPEPDGHRVRLSTSVVEPGHHRRRLHSLTGLDVQENQARRMLNDILHYRAILEKKSGAAVAESVGALRWMMDVYEPTVNAVPPELRPKLEPPEFFHQVLEHRWFLSEREGIDVGTHTALADYVKGVLPSLPDERAVLGMLDTQETPITP